MFCCSAALARAMHTHNCNLQIMKSKKMCLSVWEIKMLSTHANMINNRKTNQTHYEIAKQ